MSSLSRSLTESQGVWNQPPVHIEKRAQALGPVSIGPMRRWIRPQIFRSSQIMNIAFKAMKARTRPRLTSIGAQKGTWKPPVRSRTNCSNIGSTLVPAGPGRQGRPLIS